MSRKPSKSRGPLRADARAWDRARDVLRRHARQLLRRTGVVGVDLGIKRAKGRLLRGPSIRVHVERKLAPEALSSRQRFPERIEGVPLDVIESKFQTSTCPTSSFGHRVFLKTLQGGCSIGAPLESEFGTLGAVVLGPDGSRGGLTCAHVANHSAKPRVVQPHETGPSIGVVGIEAWDADIDAAFVRFDGRRPSKAAVLNYGSVGATPLDLDSSMLPLRVELVGACSGRTSGRVVSTDFKGYVEYPEGTRLVKNQLCVEPDGVPVFARNGDSGGAVLRQRRFVGLLIAAAAESGTGLVTPMSRVLSRLGVALAPPGA